MDRSTWGITPLPTRHVNSKMGGAGIDLRSIPFCFFHIRCWKDVRPPIVYRDNYLSALRALTQNANSIPLIRMLDYVQAYTHAIDWSDLDNATTTLERTHAFADPEEARLIMPDQVPTT